MPEKLKDIIYSFISPSKHNIFSKHLSITTLSLFISSFCLSQTQISFLQGLHVYTRASQTDNKTKQRQKNSEDKGSNKREIFKILNTRDRILPTSKPVSRRTPWPLRNVCAQYKPFTATSSLCSLFTIYVTAVLEARFDSNILCKSTFQLDRTEDYAFNYRPHVKLAGRKVYHHNHYSPSHPILSVNTP